MTHNCGSRLTVPELKKEVKKLHPNMAVSKLNRPALLDLYEAKKKKKELSSIDKDIKNEKKKIKDLDEQIKALKDEKKEKRRKKYTDKNGRYYDPKKYTVDRDGRFHHRF
jgi:predicted  nucleic acid-binding Zn-ribbon protein